MKKEYSTIPWIQGLSAVCLAALAGIIGPVLFFLIMTLLGSTQPGYNAFQQTISMLVFGPHGWLQTLVFLLFGFLLIVFAVRLFFSVNKRLGSRISIAFLILIGLGFFLIGIFPTQQTEVGIALHALIHRYTVWAVTILFILACLLLGLNFRSNPFWKRFSLYTIFTAVVTFILGIMFVVLPSDRHWIGLYERILLLNGLIWVAVVAIRLLLSCLSEWRKSQKLARDIQNSFPDKVV